MSVFSNKKNPWAVTESCIVTTAQDKNDEVHLDWLGIILLNNSGLLIRK